MTVNWSLEYIICPMCRGQVRLKEDGRYRIGKCTCGHTVKTKK